MLGLVCAVIFEAYLIVGHRLLQLCFKCFALFLCMTNVLFLLHQSEIQIYEQITGQLGIIIMILAQQDN